MTERQPPAHGAKPYRERRAVGNLPIPGPGGSIYDRRIEHTDHRTASLREAVHDRLRPLRPHHREVLLRAAAIGREFDTDVLVESSGSTPARVRGALRAARAQQLIEPVGELPGRFRFRHALTRDAVYGELIAAQLRPLHREIASALERLASRRGSDLDELAYHWWAAGDADRGAFYNEAAGDRAANLHAAEDAIRSYRRALDVLPPRSPVRDRVECKIVALVTPPPGETA